MADVSRGAVFRNRTNGSDLTVLKVDGRIVHCFQDGKINHTHIAWLEHNTLFEFIEMISEEEVQALEAKLGITPLHPASLG